MATITVDLPRAGLLRRLAAILYDSLLLLAVLFIAAALPTLLFAGGTAADGAMAPSYENHPVYRALFSMYLFLVAFGFFGWFWLHGGQTLGMRAWRIRVVTFDGKPIGPWHALLRYLVAIASWLPLGLGFWWSLWDKERLCWHDRYSETVLVVLPKQR